MGIKSGWRYPGKGLAFTKIHIAKRMNADPGSSQNIPTNVVTMNDKHLTSRLTIPVALILGLVVGLSLPTTFAASKYWDTSATAGLQPGNGPWDTTTSIWNPLAAGTDPLTTWANNDDAFFQTGGTNVVALSGTVQANSLSFLAATATTLNGGTLQLNSASVGINTAGATDSSTLTINSNVTVGASQNWQTSNGTVLTVNGDITGLGNTVTFTAGGTGGLRQIYLNGINTLGGITVTGTGSTARSLNLNNSTILTGALRSSGTTNLNALIYSGADLNVGSIELSNGAITLGGNNTAASVSMSSGKLTIERDANIGSGSLSLDGGTLRILGTTLTTFGARTVTYATGSSTIFDIADAGNTFTLDKVIGGGTAAQLTKAGQGTLVLNKANTYGDATRGTIVRSGTLQIDANNGGSVNSASALTMNGGTLLLTGKTADVTSQSILGAMTLGQFGSTIRADGGASTSTTLNLGAITATTAGGTLNFSTTGTTVPVVTTTSDKDATGIYGGRITYNGSNWATTASGGSPYTLSAYAGYATLNTAVGAADTANSLLTAGGTTSITGGPGTRQTNTLKIANAGAGSLDIVAGNTLTLAAGGLLFTGSTDYSIINGTITSGTATNSDLIVHQNGTGGILTLGSVIANGIGASTLTKTGAGTLVLTGANTYTGFTYINEGVLSVSVVSGTNNNLGAAANQQLNINNGTLQYTGATATTNRNITLGGGGGTIDVTNGATTLTLSGNIADYVPTTNNPNSASLTKIGAGTLALSGTNGNSFSGGLNIQAGVVQVGHATALNSTTPNIVSFGSGSTGILRLNGFSVTVAGLNTHATPGTTFVENNSASTASTLTVNSTFASSYAGEIRNGAAASLSLVKTGANTLTLSGANSFTGTTLVSAGTLLVSGTLAGTTGVTVSSGGSLTLGAADRINNSATMTLASGTFNTGGFSDSLGALTLADGMTSILDFGSGASVILFSGITNNSGILNLTNWNFGTDSLRFTSNTNLVAGSFTINGGAASIVNQGAYYEVVPEPSTWALLAFSLTTVMVLRRRRA